MLYDERTILLAHMNGTLETFRKEMIRVEIRKVYDLDDELAISRQQQTKPEKFAKYYEYVDSCIAKIDAYIEQIITKV